jgi:hypothetical protein
VFSAAFSPDGKRIVTASADKTARLWAVFATTRQLISAAKAAIPRCLTGEQRTAFFLPPELPAWCVLRSSAAQNATDTARQHVADRLRVPSPAPWRIDAPRIQSSGDLV